MEIDEKIEEAFKVIEQINEVKVSASFKQNVLEKALDKNQQENLGVHWFTPKLQLAAMIIVILVNITALTYTFSSTTKETTISSFAEDYSIGLTNNSSLIN